MTCGAGCTWSWRCWRAACPGAPEQAAPPAPRRRRLKGATAGGSGGSSEEAGKAGLPRRRGRAPRMMAQRLKQQCLGRPQSPVGSPGSCQVRAPLCTVPSEPCTQASGCCPLDVLRCSRSLSCGKMGPDDACCSNMLSTACRPWPSMHIESVDSGGSEQHLWTCCRRPGGCQPVPEGPGL